MAMSAASKSKFFPNNFFSCNAASHAEHARSCVRLMAIVLLLSPVGSDARAEAFSINDAISQAVHTNPGVGEAAASRRATEM